MKQRLLEQAVLYFKSKTAFDILFKQMREKYASRGNLGGKFNLSGLTPEEKSQLGGFFKQDFSRSTQVSISYPSLKKALADSRFEDLTWEEILAEYFGKTLLIKKQEREKEDVQRDAFWKDYMSNCPNSCMADWLSTAMQEKNGTYRLLKTKYEHDKNGLRDLLDNLQHAFDSLPLQQGRTENIAVFAANITGNPHFFDHGELANTLLFHYIQFCFPDIEKAGLSKIEFMEKCLFHVGILKDDLSNMCLIYGVHGIKKDDGLHAGIEGFFEEKQPMQLTLKTLSQLKKLVLGNNEQEKKVYVVENPAVFSYLINRYPDEAIICSNGQLRLACYVAMELFDKNITFYYAGDFDPEGLQIAQNLKRRYGERLILWQYQAKYYWQSLSDVALEEKRLKKLEQIDLPELREIKEALLKEKRAAYQEAMLETYRI